MKKTDSQKNTVSRPPVVVVMGHIDHGKSTLLDYIRKTNVVEGEAGGITQHMSAYEVVHPSGDGKERKVTFIDTPGHEAFSALRSRGASVADLAILVVSAEDNVKPQTLEALGSIRAQEIPFVVAINKIDKPGANVERARQSLAENEIYIEGYGGNVPAVAISAKTGEGIPELLDMVFLVAELEELSADPSARAEGVVIESSLDSKKGISATLVIKNGTLLAGAFVAAGGSVAPVRIMENFLGEKIKSATFSSPVKIIGWDKLPSAGSIFMAFKTKNEALEYAALARAAALETEKKVRPEVVAASAKTGAGVGAEGEPAEIKRAVLPLIVKADTAGSLEALLHEIGKIKEERLQIRIIEKGVGTIGEGDVKLAGADKKIVVVGFNTKIDTPAKNLADRDGVQVKTFDIIYKLTDWLKEIVVERTPKVLVDEVTGTAKILRIFSKNKDKQIIGGRVENGFLSVGETIKIIRRESEVGTGKVRGLQSQKKDASEVKEGNEFGALVDSKIEIAAGDKLLSFRTVEK